MGDFKKNINLIESSLLHYKLIAAASKPDTVVIEYRDKVSLSLTSLLSLVQPFIGNK